MRQWSSSCSSGQPPPRSQIFYTLRDHLLSLVPIVKHKSKRRCGIFSLVLRINDLVADRADRGEVLHLEVEHADHIDCFWTTSS